MVNVTLTGDDEIKLPTMWMQNIVINAGKRGIYDVFFVAYDVEPENQRYFLEQIMMEYAIEFGIV